MKFATRLRWGYRWQCDQPGCGRVVRARKRADFKHDVMWHRKMHNTTEMPPPFETVWDDALYGDSSAS